MNATSAARLGLLTVMIVAAGIMLFPRGSSNEVLVLCGGSMKEVLDEIILRYKRVSDDPVIATYGGSGDLCAQMQKTGRGDIYICHDPFMPWAAEQGLIDRWDTVGYLDVVIIAQKGNPKNIRGLKDLAQPGLRLGIGDRTYSTSGQIAKAMFKQLDYGDEIRRNIRMESKGHQKRCMDVAMETLDASIVWGPVAQLFSDRLEIMPIPDEYVHAVTSATYGESDLKNVKVTVGVITYARDREPARRFYEFITSECRNLFAQHGFRTTER